MIIFNADDYALTKIDLVRVNNSIPNKIIQSSTAVANGSEIIFPSNLHSISTGIHINLVEGHSLTMPHSLTDENGCFLTKSELFKRITFGRVCTRELEREIAAQFETLFEIGISISHIDSHQNIHIAPPILQAIIRVGEEFKVRKIRGQRSEYKWFGSHNKIKAHIKNVFSTYWQSLLPKHWITTGRIILNAPGLGQHVTSINAAVSMWELAINRFYSPNLVYEVPCHLCLSNFEFELYNSSQFSNMIKRNQVKIGSYHDI